MTEPAPDATAAAPPTGAAHGLRYLGGAVLCALVNNVVLIAGSHAGWSDHAGVLVGWLCGGTTGYLWHHRISFAVPTSLGGYARFLAGSALGIPLAWLAVVGFHRVLGWSMWAAAPAATVALFAYNYASARVALLWRRGAAGQD